MKAEFPEWLSLDKVRGIFRVGNSTAPRIAAIGMFDGVHRGHLSLIDFLKSEGAKRGETPTVVTFADHPLRVVRPDDAPKLLASLDRKMSLLRAAGVEDCVLLDFTQKLRRQSARQFMEHLRNAYGVATLVVGFNHHVGSDRVAGIDAYRAIGSQIGLEVIAAPEWRDENGAMVSSSVIRRLIEEGELDRANEMLGHPFAIDGVVVDGRKVGRTIGFPTANIKPVSDNQLLPVAGVYAAAVTTPDGVRRQAMVNIGYRPTVSADEEPMISIEANIFDYLGYLYGEKVDVEFLKYMRKEKRFSSVDRLKAAIASDEAHIRQYFEKGGWK